MALLKHPSPALQVRKSLPPPAPILTPDGPFRVATAPKPFAVTEARWLPVKSKRMTVAEAGMLAAAMGF